MLRLATVLLLALPVPTGSALAVWMVPPIDSEAAQTWPGRVPAADSRGYDVLAYRLELDLAALPPQTPRLVATGRIHLRLLAAIPHVRLDLVNQFEISAVTCDGVAAAWTHAGDSLSVVLPVAAVAGAEHVVAIDYAGTPPRHGPYYAGLLLRTHGDMTPDDPTDDGPSVGNVSQPYSSHSWFPGKDHPADKARLEMTVTAPDTLTVVATGRLLGTADLPAGRRRWDWATDYPVAPYLIGLAVSNYDSWYESCGGEALEFHVFPEHREIAAAAFAPTCAMLAWLQDRFGPYPFAGEKYAQAEFVWGGAIENQTVTLMGQATLLLPERSAHLVVVHELAHHWFGNSLTPSTWRDIWLNEGFARYCEALWLEHTEDRQSYFDYLALLRRPTLFVGDGLLGDPDPVLPNLLVYDKGAWVLHMLRHELGDAVFFAALRAYATAPELVRALTDRAAMTAVFSRHAGRDLAPFLAPWLDSDAVPALDIRQRRLGQGRHLVEIVQSQSGPFFPLTVPVRIFAGAQTVDLRLPMQERLAACEVATAAPIDSLRVDPDGWLLHRTAVAPAPALLAASPQPNPAEDAVHLAYWLAGADRVTAAVYDARGRLVLRRALGVQPATGSRDEGGEPLIWSWNGCTDDGRQVAAGVYWLELRTSRDRTARKVTLLR
jgi:aminopeptidase N